MGSAIFWGLILIIIGISFIFRIVFDIDFPIFKIIIAFLFIFLGIKLLFGSFGSGNINVGEKDVLFGEKNFHHFEDRAEYSVIFGQGNYDFRDVDLSEGTKKVKLSTVFGSSRIRISRETPVRIRVDAAFSGVDLPNGNTTVFGNSSYESPGFDPSLPFLDIKIDVVFGGINLRLY